MKKLKLPKIKKPKRLKIKKQRQLICYREIIYRSSNRTKVFRFSPKFQLGFVLLFLTIFVGAFYSYYFYNKSGRLISNTQKELETTKDAYVDLVSEVAVLQKNSRSKDLKVEDKIKDVIDEKAWIDQQKLTTKMEVREALLQRDIARSERDALKSQIDELDKIVKKTKEAELELLDKVEQIASKEIIKIKNALNSINEPLKKRGLYFNILSNVKKGGKGGPYIPDRTYLSDDKDIEKKINTIFETVDNIDAYKEGIKNVPVGKPVWSYWVTSHYGTRNDPIRGGKASHKGVDLASRTGNKIRIKAQGKVTKAEYSGAYGNLIVVDHQNGFKTKYAHLSKMLVKKGQYVNFDDVIGEVGSTGRSTGPHLHYEVSFQGKDVNPINFVKARY